MSSPEARSPIRNLVHFKKRYATLLFQNANFPCPRIILLPWPEVINHNGFYCTYKRNKFYKGYLLILVNLPNPLKIVNLSGHKKLPDMSRPVQFSPPPCNLITKTSTLIDQLTVSFITNLGVSSSKAFNPY